MFLRRLLRRGKGVTSVGDGCILYRAGDGVCGKKALILEAISSTLAEVAPLNILHFLKAFYNSLNLGFPVEVRTFIAPLSRDEFLKSVNRRLEAALVTLEVNPSNAGLRARVRRLEQARDRVLKEGLAPFDVVALFIVEACGGSEDDVRRALDVRSKVLKDTLTALGVRVREVRGVRASIIRKLFFRPTNYGGGSGVKGLIARLLVPRLRLADYTLAILYPFIISAGVRLFLRSEGVFLGVDLVSGEEVYWNVSESLSPHILVVGPTGSGKTEFLSVIAGRLDEAYSPNIIVFDVKGEYPYRLSRYGTKFRELVFGRDVGLGIIKLLTYLPRGLRAGLLTDIIAKSFPLGREREVVTSLYRGLSHVLNNFGSIDSCVLNGYEDCSTRFFSSVGDYVEAFEDGYVSYRVDKVLKAMESFELGTPLVDLIASGRGVTVLNLSNVIGLGREVISLVAEVLVKAVEVSLSRVLRPLNTPTPRVALIVDEGWAMVSTGSAVAEVLRLGRGYGVLAAVATQFISDISALGPGMVNNVGLLVALPSPDRDYWEGLALYMKVSSSDVERFTTLLGRGEAVVRISPDPRPIAIRFSQPCSSA